MCLPVCLVTSMCVPSLRPESKKDTDTEHGNVQLGAEEEEQL